MFKREKSLRSIYQKVNSTHLRERSLKRWIGKERGEASLISLEWFNLKLDRNDQSPSNFYSILSDFLG